MFDWNEEDGVIATIWGNFDEREHHLVPYPNTDEDGISKIGDYPSKQGDEQKYTGVRSTEPSISGSKNELPSCNLDSNSYLHTKEELPGSRFLMDSWSNFSVDTAFCNGGGNGKDHGSTSSTMVNDFTDAPNMDDSTFTELCQSGDILDDNYTSSFKETHGFPFHDRVKCDSKPGDFSGEHGQKEVDSFLDCDWGSIMDLDELDGILRDGGSIFGQEMTRDVDELLSPTDSTNTPPFLMHDMSMSNIAPDEKGSCSFQENRSSQGKRKSLKDDKIADHTAAGEQTGCLPKFTCGTYQTDGQDSDNVDGQKKLLKSRRKKDENRTTKSRKPTSAWSYNANQIQQFEKYEPFSTASQTFPSSVSSQQGHPGGPGYMGYYAPSHQAFTGYGYPALPFPSIPVLPHGYAVSGCPQPAPASYYIYSQQAGHPNSVQNPDITSRTPTMTPQEKIEKLRRHQQMQAMLAIKQQGKQFGQQVGNTDISITQKLAQMNQNQDSVLSSIEKAEERAEGVCLSEPNMPLEQEDSYVISVASDDCALQEAIFCEFQETVMKLENNLRLCMKESLLRLASGALERRSANDRSSANANSRKEGLISTNETRMFQDRSSAAPNMERDTNAIDRIVVNLLFHPVTSFTRPVKEGMPLSPVPGNIGTKQSSTWECTSEHKAKNVEEMKGNTSL